MRVRCIANAYNLLPSTSLLYADDCGDAKIPLEIGQDYVVYGLWGRGYEILYSVHSDPYSRFPRWYPSMLFEMIDGQLPSCWRYAPEPDPESGLPSFLMVFPEWASDRSFYWNLVDGELTHQDLWQRYRALMNEESNSSRSER